jgi:hypothetical protein
MQKVKNSSPRAVRHANRAAQPSGAILRGSPAHNRKTAGRVPWYLITVASETESRPARGLKLPDRRRDDAIKATR